MVTILIVDDSPTVRRMLEFTLRKQGYKVLAAMNGQEALSRLAETAVDLVITDVSMPVLDGIALLQQIRTDSRWQTLPVVMLTVSGQVQDRLEAQQHGADGFLTKPASSSELIETVQKFV
jgi:two-component system, chemotaxis family, chemotaxis protein CheY